MAIKRKWGVTPVGPLMADSVAKAVWLSGILSNIPAPHNEWLMPKFGIIAGRLGSGLGYNLGYLRHGSFGRLRAMVRQIAARGCALARCPVALPLRRAVQASVAAFLRPRRWRLSLLDGLDYFTRFQITSTTSPPGGRTVSVSCSPAIATKRF